MLVAYFVSKKCSQTATESEEEFLRSYTSAWDKSTSEEKLSLCKETRKLFSHNM